MLATTKAPSSASRPRGLGTNGRRAMIRGVSAERLASIGHQVSFSPSSGSASRPMVEGWALIARITAVAVVQSCIGVVEP